MKRFSCPLCQNELHFSNSLCLRCNAAVAFDPVSAGFVSLPPDGGIGEIAPCANRDTAACNWLAEDGGFCAACRHNRTIPDLSLPENAPLWADYELAKRYLFYSIKTWGLPHPTREEYPENGLAFDFLSDVTLPDGQIKKVLTGHANGLITLNIAEADDAERVARREALGEPYRTLIGHLRHEIGHFYWDILIRDGGRLAMFREIFGDESQDYGAALQANYADGPPKGWETSYISSYAASHPWEDWAECWAHYIHIVDASETAHAFGMTLRGSGTVIETNPYAGEDFEELIADWVPLTVAMNSLNRSMGLSDLYPFVLSDPVEAKLNFIHNVIAEAGTA